MNKIQRSFNFNIFMAILLTFNFSYFYLYFNYFKLLPAKVKMDDMIQLALQNPQLEYFSYLYLICSLGYLYYVVRFIYITFFLSRSFMKNISPILAVMLFIIPIFNVVGYFVVFYKWAKNYKNYCVQNFKDENYPRVSIYLGFFYALVFFIQFLIKITANPEVAIYLDIFFMLLTVFVFQLMFKATNYLIEQHNKNIHQQEQE